MLAANTKAISSDAGGGEKRCGRVVAGWCSCGRRRPGSCASWSASSRRAQAFWDRMLAVTGAPGIHFEDHPELAGFDCPEWSHLTAADAVRYSRALMPLMAAAWPSRPGGI